MELSVLMKLSDGSRNEGGIGMNTNCTFHQPMRGDARRYPDAMTLTQAAEYLNVSTKLTSKLIHDGKFYAKKVGREYRVSKKSLMEYVRGERKLNRENCVVTVTSTPQHWTFSTPCDIVCVAKKQKEVREVRFLLSLFYVQTKVACNFYAACALALMDLITCMIPTHTVVSTNTSATSPLSVNGDS